MGGFTNTTYNIFGTYIYVNNNTIVIKRWIRLIWPLCSSTKLGVGVGVGGALWKTLKEYVNVNGYVIGLLGWFMMKRQKDADAIKVNIYYLGALKNISLSN